MGIGSRRPPTEDEYTDYFSRFRNWSRWGESDEFGTLNFITPTVRVAAGALVRNGITVSCSRPIDSLPGPANPYPARHMVPVMDQGIELGDYLQLYIHGVTQTHIDALCHFPMVKENRAWNGLALDRYHMPVEHTGTIDFWSDGIVTRGVLYDIPRLRGVEYVSPGAPVHGWELADAADAQGVEPHSGDAVIIRSGFGPYFASEAQDKGFSSQAGVHASCLEFLYEHDAALLAWDMIDAPLADQGIPSPSGDSFAMHVHQVALPYMGLPILDNADLEALAVTCERLGRWEFLFVVAPLIIRRGTGSPVNPLAVF